MKFDTNSGKTVSKVARENALFPRDSMIIIPTIRCTEEQPIPYAPRYKGQPIMQIKEVDNPERRKQWETKILCEPYGQWVERTHADNPELRQW